MLSSVEIQKCFKILKYTPTYALDSANTYSLFLSRVVDAIANQQDPEDPLNYTVTYIVDHWEWWELSYFRQKDNSFDTADEAREGIIRNVLSRNTLQDVSTKDMPPEFIKLVNDNFFDLI